MLAVSLRQCNVDPAEILADAQNERLLVALNRFKNILAGLGYRVRAYTEGSLRRLATISPEKKAQIISSFENRCSWLEPVDPRLPSEDKEKIFLKRALDHYGLEASDDFWKTLGHGQIVELYGDDMVQLYHTSQFYDITGYSLLDLSVYEWFVLWDRPKYAMEKMMESVRSVLNEYIPVQRVPIPSHLIREIHHTSFTEPFEPRSAMAEFLYIGSLREKKSTSQGTSQKGLILSSRGKLLSVGEEALAIRMI